MPPFRFGSYRQRTTQSAGNSISLRGTCSDRHPVPAVTQAIASRSLAECRRNRPQVLRCVICRARHQNDTSPGGIATDYQQWMIAEPIGEHRLHSHSVGRARSLLACGHHASTSGPPSIVNQGVHELQFRLLTYQFSPGSGAFPIDITGASSSSDPMQRHSSGNKSEPEEEAMLATKQGELNNSIGPYCKLSAARF